ncbi:DUF6191 domain-containing protein [Streptomyces argenteolus]|uniref:DUF6191 domain-containing protein n=1 Tax=Streptomyces sp. NPDC025273 TaxID=3155251 RepID=UPI00337698EB
MFNFFEELFAPGRRHIAEEQKRLELSRVDLGIGDPARGPIDLASGTVTLRRPPAEPSPDGARSEPEARPPTAEQTRHRPDRARPAMEDAPPGPGRPAD